MTQKIIAIIGPGEDATKINIEGAKKIGELIAQNNFVLLTGGRNSGVMNAASKGAKEAGGIVIGILPTEKNVNTSSYVDIPIYTGVGSARNNFIVLSAQLVIAIGIGAGTSSEISLAIKADIPVVLFRPEKYVLEFFLKISPSIHYLYEYHELEKYLKNW